LNLAHLNGALVVGGIAGLVTNSSTVFIFTTVAMIAAAIYQGGIRGRPQR